MLSNFKNFLKLQYLIEKNSNFEKDKIEKIANIINNVIEKNLNNKIILKENINEFTIAKPINFNNNFKIGKYYIDLENIINNLFENISEKEKHKIVFLIKEELLENEKFDLKGEMKKWMKQFGSTKQVVLWRKYFKDFEIAKQWNEFFDDASEAYKWYKKGYKPEEANKLSMRYNVDDLSESLKENKKKKKHN